MTWFKKAQHKLRIALVFGDAEYVVTVSVMEFDDYAAMVKRELDDVPRAFCAVHEDLRSADIVLARGVSDSLAKVAHEASHVADRFAAGWEGPLPEDEFRAVLCEYVVRSTCHLWGIHPKGQLHKHPAVRKVRCVLDMEEKA